VGEFDELKRLADAATPGGWAVVEQKYPHRYMRRHIERMIVTAYDDGQLKSPYPIVATATGVGIGDKPIYFCHISEENAEYIAAANPAAILALLAHIDSLAEQLAAEKAEHLKERARLDWATEHAVEQTSNGLFYQTGNYEDFHRFPRHIEATNPRATIDALMKGK